MPGRMIAFHAELCPAPMPPTALLAALLSLGLLLPPPAVRVHGITMVLCSGGRVLVGGDGQPAPADQPGACHAVCAARRDDNDGD